MKRYSHLLSVTFALLLILFHLRAAAAADEGPKLMKTQSVFYAADRIKIARDNAARYPWAKEVQDKIVRRARPWMKMSDDELWGLMFGNTIRRAWHVWSSFRPAPPKDSAPRSDISQGG
ncbi:MAG: hypothetical protein HQ592_02765 [Planctomycetes bacterium]|nr:hypothetical protein [Planctomycetota bacterium]